MKRFLFLPVLWFTVLTTQAQTDPVVMTVNGVPVPRSEFAYSYYKNNGHGQADRKTVEEYASLYANYKLKLAAALETRLDTTLAYRQTLASYLNRQGGEPWWPAPMCWQRHDTSMTGRRKPSVHRD